MTGRTQYLEYILLVVSALLMYFAFFFERCCKVRTEYLLAIGIPVFLIGLWRLK